MRFFAYHGFYEEERQMGTEFVLDVYVHLADRMGNMKDDLANTINYETIFLICQAEMRKTVQLLETVVERILTRLRTYFENKVSKVRVRLKKLNPPLGGQVDCAYIEIER